MRAEEKKRQGKLYFMLFIVLVALHFFGYTDIFFIKNGVLSWLPFVFACILIPFVLFKALDAYFLYANKEAIKSIAYASVIVFGILTGLWAGYITEKDLNENGVKIVGRVNEKWWNKRRNVAGEWLIKCSFVVDGKEYETFSETDTTDKYKVGDFVIIIYSSRNPENSKIGYNPFGAIIEGGPSDN